LKTHSIALALSLCAVMLFATAAPAQKKKTRTVHRTRHHVVVRHKKVTSSPAYAPETSLGGIKLYDTGTHVVAVYGSPDDLQVVTLGGSTAGPGGGAAGGAGGRGLPGGGKGPAGTAPMGMAPSAGSIGPGVPGDFGFDGGGSDLQRGAPGPAGVGVAPAPGGGGASPGGGGGMGPAKGGMGGGSASGGESDRILYTRWVYNRNATKFGFIVDQWDHVVQCEAIGIEPGKARTRRGITFGSTFAQVIKKYQAPDGYEINGDSIVLRYLSHDKVAFRLNRLGENKPYVVTGIVVAAGKH